MNIWRIFKVFLFALLITLPMSCADDDGPSLPHSNREKVKLAVILPMGENEVDWNRVLNWAKTNILEANDCIEPEYEFYNENEEDIELISKELSEREDVAAIIGCFHSVNTMKLARHCAKKGKPLFTFSTSNELPRAFGQKGFLWSLAESDITQSELLLLEAKRRGAVRVSLLASDDIYGQTFTDWFAFQAVELGLEPVKMAIYQNDNLQAKCTEVLREPSDFLICAPATVEDACTMKQTQLAVDSTANILFTDMAYSPTLIANLGESANQIEGFAQAADPSSGFSVSYRAYFEEQPSVWEAYIYDAVMIACYGYRYAQLHNTDMNKAISVLLNQKAPNSGMWTSGSMREVYIAIEGGGTPAFSGASGNLDFSTDNYTTVQYSTYTLWQVYNGKFLHIDYETRTKESGSSAFGSWEWNKRVEQVFDENSQPDILYPERKGNWAIVVAASNTWRNYRHQADALAFYQMLKQNGYDDDHIILIMEDDLAYNFENPEQGVIRRVPNGENLYQNVVIDHNLSFTSSTKLEKIFLGEVDNSLQSGPNDNVVLFWSGHGSPGEWIWGEMGAFTAERASSTFSKMAQEKRYRKMLCFVETCYSGSVAEACEGIPGLMLFTAANPMEPSKADIFNNDLGTFMTNRFTSVLLEETAKDPNIPLRNLYYEMFHRTLGSHVCIYNADNYGNVFENTTKEFLNPWK